MPKTSLTVASVERVRPPARSQIEYFDRGYPGLALRVSHGGAKSWCIFYRIGGHLRRMSLGTYPAVGLAEAREAWRAARQTVSRGIDPRRQPTSRADTFGVVVAEWVRRDQSKNKASTLYQTTRIIQTDLLPAWASSGVDTITKRDVIELLDGIVDRGAIIKARRVFAHLHRFFKWCMSREIITANPMSGLSRPGSETSRERVLSDAELVAVWKAGAEGPFGAVARMLILTGARLNEISRLKWSEIDGEVIKLEGERTKNGKPHTITLATPARALLDTMPRTGEYVFSVDCGKRPITGWSRGKAKLDSLAMIEPWRLHDLRRTVATGLQKLGVNLQIIEAVLGHLGGSRAGIVGVYQRHGFDAEKHAALRAWGAHVMALVEGRKPGKVLFYAHTRLK
jgi:integrase